MPSKNPDKRKSKSVQRGKAAPRERSAASVAEQIAKLVSTGRYGLGEQLDAAELQRELGVDSQTVDEALRQLAGEGIVELSGDGNASIPHVTTTQLLEMLRVQDALSRLALQEMVASPDYSLHMAKLFAQARKMRERAQARDHGGVLRCMIRYHELVGEASGNRYLMSITRRHYLYHFERRILDTARFEELERAVGPYEKATQALLRRDATRAHQCMSIDNYEFIVVLATESAAATEQELASIAASETLDKPAPRKRRSG